MQYEARLDEANNEQVVVICDASSNERGRFYLTQAHSYSRATAVDCLGDDVVEVKFEDGTRKTFTFTGHPR